jgi:hypothetical protein
MGSHLKDFSEVAREELRHSQRCNRVPAELSTSLAALRTS